MSEEMYPRDGGEFLYGFGTCISPANKLTGDADVCRSFRQSVMRQLENRLAKLKLSSLFRKKGKAVGSDYVTVSYGQPHLDELKQLVSRKLEGFVTPEYSVLGVASVPALEFERTEEENSSCCTWLTSCVLFCVGMSRSNDTDAERESFLVSAELKK